jgi:hypothetical protein
MRVRALLLAVSARIESYEGMFRLSMASMNSA